MSRGWSRWVVMIIVRDCTDCCTIVTQIYHPSLTKLAPPTGLQRWPQKNFISLPFQSFWFDWKIDILNSFLVKYILYLEFNFIFHSFTGFLILLCILWIEDAWNCQNAIFVFVFEEETKIFLEYTFSYEKKCNCEIVGRISVELLMWTD